MYKYMSKLLFFTLLLPAESAANPVAESPWPTTEQELLDDLANWSHEKLKAVKESDVQELVTKRRWIKGARSFVLRRREAGADDLDATVRQSVKKIRNELDDLVRSLDKNYGRAQQISPAFQWAQNSTHVFLSVKFAARWNAPGALEVKNATCTMNDKDLFFSGVGEHSMIVKNYTLSLILKENCKLADWGMKSVGRMSITLEKETEKKWSTLLDPKNPKVKYGVWDAMQERLDKETKDKKDAEDAAKNSNSTSTDDNNKTDTKKKSKKDKKKKRKKSSKKEVTEESEPETEDDDNDEDEEDVCDLPSIYSGSKVKALCQKNFDKTVAKTGPWLIKFFDEEPSKQKQTHEMVHIWKHLAGTLPLQHCRIGVVDCKQNKNLCNALHVTDRVPVAMRYASAGADPVEFEGEMNMEQVAEFAVKGEQTKVEL